MLANFCNPYDENLQFASHIEWQAGHYARENAKGDEEMSDRDDWGYDNREFK